MATFKCRACGETWKASEGKWASTFTGEEHKPDCKNAPREVKDTHTK